MVNNQTIIEIGLDTISGDSFTELSAYITPSIPEDPSGGENIQYVTPNDNMVIIDVNLSNDLENPIIKIELTYDYESNNSVDETYNYNLETNFRGNMLHIINSNNNALPKRFKHNYYFSEVKNKFITLVNFYTMNGKIFTRKINLINSQYSFINNIGDLNILNSQFIDNDYNYLFVIAETKKGHIVQFSLEQKANRGQAKIPTPESEFEPAHGEIVRIGNPNIYLYLIDNSEPIYLILDPSILRNLATIKDHSKLIETIKDKIKMVQMKSIEEMENEENETV